MKKQELTDCSPTKQITVLLAEDHAKFRKSLKLLVELDGDIEVVGEAKNGCDAVRMTKSIHPEVIVMDIAMPQLNGLEATKQIMESAPATRVLILSANSDPEYIKQAMLLGASGYLIKQSSALFLTHAIREVLKGHTYFSSSISKLVCDHCRQLFSKAELVKKKVLQIAHSNAALNC
jgi:DNA-binding NarL/FixJ family response regulator